MDDVEIRPAGPQDAIQMADVYLASFRDEYDFPLAHDDEQVRAWIRDVVIPTEEVWVAVAPAGHLVAMMALAATALEQLYVAPGWTGRRIGSRLLDLAKARRPDGLDLYTFQVNIRARRFYERNGFVETGSRDGSANEEGQPDVRYSWRP